MFKWICLLVAVAALSAFGWMLNDMRLQVKGLVEKADQHLPRILTQTEQVSGQLDKHLPKLLDQTDKAATMINSHLPLLLNQTQRATLVIDTHLPALLVNAETAVDNITDLSDNFKQYKGLMGLAHVGVQTKEVYKDLSSYGSGLLNFVEGTNATIGVKKPGTGQGLKHAVSARVWAATARKDAQFLSLISSNKADLLHGLSRTHSVAPLHIQIGDQPPRPLADWLKEMHPESKELK